MMAIKRVSRINNLTRAVLFLFIFTLGVPVFCQAQTAKEAKEILIESMPGLKERGASVSRPMSVEQIEKRSLKRITGCKDCPQVPFGFINEDWVKFRSKYKEGDLILHFRTGTKSWQERNGREGYALIRGKNVVDVIIIMLS